MSMNGSLVITDRFPQNQHFNVNDGPKLQGGKCFGWAADLEMRLLGKSIALGPNIVIKMDVSPKNAFSRTGEYSFSEIKEKIEGIKKITFHRAKILNIDANQSYPTVLNEVQSKLWDAIKESI
jgi:hypothetical protein